MNEIKLTSTYYLTEVISALVQEGYTLEVKRGRNEDEIIIRWASADRKTEPTSCKTCRYGEVDEGYVRCAYYSKADRKTEPTCDTCRHKGVEGCEQPCLGCGCCGLYEAMTENDKLKEKVVEFIKSCARCKHRPIGAMMCEESCNYEPKDEPQTDCDHKCIQTEIGCEKTDCAWK